LPRDGTGWDSQTKSGKGRGTGQGFEILPQDGPGRDFDSLSRPIPEYPRITKGQKGKKNKKRKNLKKEKNCPGIFSAGLVTGQRDSKQGNFFVPGQRDGRTTKLFCPGTKGQWDVPSQIVPGCPFTWKPYYLPTLIRYFTT
jgi:hypothetical protein